MVEGPPRGIEWVVARALTRIVGAELRLLAQKQAAVPQTRALFFHSDSMTAERAGACDRAANNLNYDETGVSANKGQSRSYRQ